RDLPETFPAPIVCVQHIGAGFMRGLVDWLRTDCKLKIKMAEAGEALALGTVYFPQENSHLVVDRHNRLMISQEPALNGHRPSVDMTFRSVAAHYGRSAAAVLLTGMGEDGAAGLKEISDAGGLTIAQDERTS